MALPPRVSVCTFLSTPSARRATRSGAAKLAARIFLSTPSARRATYLARPERHDLREDFYPRPPRGGRPCGLAATRVGVYISIHALREEGDQERGGKAGCKDISIHALREEGDVSCPT